MRSFTSRSIESPLQVGRVRPRRARTHVGPCRLIPLATVRHLIARCFTDIQRSGPRRGVTRLSSQIRQEDWIRGDDHLIKIAAARRSVTGLQNR